MSKRTGLRILLASLLYPALLFGAAGTLAWGEGWAFLAVQALATWWLMAWLGRHDPALRAERLKGLFQPGQPLWDRVLMACFALLWLAWLVLAGLDARFGWSALPVWLEAVGGGLLVTGWWGIFLTHRENTFLAPVVRIQTERAHRVIDSGPYALVRHPMYAAFLLWLPGAALLLGSWAALAASAVVVLPLVIRTELEDRMLARELAGYEAYRARVRYRLVPGLW